MIGPALSALDAHIGYVLGAATRAKDVRRAAQHAAAAQEARAMLGGPAIGKPFLDLMGCNVHGVFPLMPAANSTPC